MGITKSTIKRILLDIFFPKFCFGCQKEGTFLCEDCKSLLEISGFHQKYKTENLEDLYFAVGYQNPLIKKLIQKFKYPPLVKELANPLASLIIDHLQLIGKETSFANAVLIPAPLEKKRLKWRGFNQAEEIGKVLAEFFKIPILTNVLFKTKNTKSQVELAKEEREKNIKGAFEVKNQNLIERKRIFLIDDIYTTGSTLKEAAQILKTAGAKEIIGIVIARAKPEEDFLPKS